VGSTFTLTLPIASEAPMADSMTASALVIDDSLREPVLAS
jgi:hypothetical protein